MSYKINNHEIEKLNGQPHLQQLTYLIGIRPYMDFNTGITGIKRGISYQSLSEELYVEPHTGYKGGSPSKDQIRRALKGLERAGLIKFLSTNRKLILECLQADRDFNTQNKPASKPTHQATNKKNKSTRIHTSLREDRTQQDTTYQNAKAAIPPVSDIYTHSLEQRIISKKFKPSPETIEKAKKLNCPTVNCQDELESFIAYQLSHGTRSHNWDAAYLHWLLKAKQYYQEKNNVKTKRQHKPIRQKSNSIIERVFNANQTLIES